MQTRLVPAKVYVTVAIALLLLLVATVVFAEIDFGALNPALALTFAFAKASLIMLYFMHLRYGSNLTRVFAAGGFVWLAFLAGLTLSDVLTRESTAPPAFERNIRLERMLRNPNRSARSATSRAPLTE